MAVRFFTSCFLLCITAVFITQLHAYDTNTRYWIPEAHVEVNFLKYNSYDDILLVLKNLGNRYPHCEVIKIGETAEGRDLVVMKIGKEQTKKKPAIFIDGTKVARDWMTGGTALYFIRQLALDPAFDPYITHLDWYIMPIMNPDGYEYSRKYSNSWRKNRSGCKDVRDMECGVHLNRNFEMKWEAQHLNYTKPESMFYRGQAAASEKETQAVQKFMLKKKDRLVSYLTLHSYGQFWFYPYGYSKNAKPDDVQQLIQLAENATKEIKKFDKNSIYTVKKASGIYLSGGGSDDWAKAKAGVKFVYTVVLPPPYAYFVDPATGQPSADIRGYQPHPGIIKKVTDRLWPGIALVASASYAHFVNFKSAAH